VTEVVLKPGQIVVVEGDRHSIIHKLIAWSSGWWWTHCFIVTGADTAVEATFPRVREFPLKTRIAEYLAAKRRVAVLDYYPPPAVAWRPAVAAKARTYVGRWYNVFAVLWYFVFKTFNRTGGGSHWFCSRLVTAAYRQGAGLDLCSVVTGGAGPMYARLPAMRDGYVTPAEVYRMLGLMHVARSNADFSALEAFE